MTTDSASGRGASGRRALIGRAVFAGPGLLYVTLFMAIPLVIVATYAFLKRGRFGGVSRGVERFRCETERAARAAAPLSETVEVEINHRRGVEREELREQQAADDRDAERLAQLGAGAAAQHQGQGAEEGRQRGHQDRPEAQQAGLEDGLAWRLALVAFGVQREVEAYMTQKADQLLASLVGPGNARVQVSAAINFDKIERTTLSVDPDKQALASETKAEIVPGAQGGAGSTNVNSSYENTKSTEIFSGAIGNIRRLTVAVLVADAPVPSTGPTDTIPRYTPRSPEELARLETLVRSALGADSTRGDAVSVVSLPMPVQRAKPSVPPVPTFAEKMQPFERPALTVVGLLLAFGMGMMALRSLRTPAAVPIAARRERVEPLTVVNCPPM